MSTKKRKRSPQSRNAAERLMWGDLFGASPLIRNMSETARRELGEGLSEEHVRQRIRARMESEGLTTQAALLPTLTRKLLRIKLRPVLHAIAELIANKVHAKRIGGVIEPWFAKIGFDQWLEDFVWDYACTGEASPMFEAFNGRTFVHEFGREGEKTPTVWLIATPASDVRALQAEFWELCEKTFPDATLAKRHEESAEGARYFRLNREGRSFSEIAYDNIAERYPEMLASDDDAEFYLFEEIVKRETNTITRLASRTFDRVDKIVEFLSPTED